MRRAHTTQGCAPNNRCGHTAFGQLALSVSLIPPSLSPSRVPTSNPSSGVGSGDNCNVSMLLLWHFAAMAINAEVISGVFFLSAVKAAGSNFLIYFCHVLAYASFCMPTPLHTYASIYMFSHGFILRSMCVYGVCAHTHTYTHTPDCPTSQVF